MRSVSLRLVDMEKATIPIGFVGETLFTKVRIDCKKHFDEHPNDNVSLVVNPPKGDKYPAVVTHDGDYVIWDVTASDLLYKGRGEIQLSFTDGTHIGKSYKAGISINDSIEPNGEIPEPLANFLTQAGLLLDEVTSALNDITSATDEDIGKALSPKTVSDGVVTEWQYVETSGGGTSNYNDLDNKPQIAGVTLSGNKTLANLGIAAASDIPDVSGKADKVSSPTNGNFAGLDSNGNLTDSGHKHSDYLTQHQDITGKADKVSSATNGHFAGLDSNGNLTDSGKKASDFGTYSKPSGGIPSSDLASGVLTSIIDDTAGDGDTNKVWSADKLSDLNSALTQKYEKPQTGIPASDLASGVIPVVTGFASKVSSATSGHFAGLDGNGDLTDSGKSASDFGTYSKPSGGIPETDLSSSLTGFIGDTSTNLGSTTETTITDLTNMTIASATEGNVQLTITKTHITAYGVCNATRIRTLQDNIVCSAGNYEFSVGTIIPTAGYQIQVFNVTDNEVLVSAAASATSPVITFTLATQKTLRLRALVTSGKSIDSSNEVYLHKVVSASTPNTLASVAKGIVDGHLHGKNILAFGDSLWGDDRTNGISDFLAEYSGATIYNAGIGGTRITGDRTTSEGEKFIPFDGVTLINALISNTWTDQDAQINNIWTYVKNDTLPMLKALDLQTIDIVILAYGTNDFTANKSISDVSTAFLSAVSALLTANPKLRIVCILPPWRMFSSNTVDGDSYENSNNDTLQEFNEGIISAIKPKHTETMNMFEQLPWRAETKGHYMDSDAVHPNRNGNMVYAHVVNGKLKTMY